MHEHRREKFIPKKKWVEDVGEDMRAHDVNVDIVSGVEND